ncbi:DsbA family protein [Shewanella sp. CG12_big_fil_rev_8_21_14_0_65_47_15]|uniref:DsbA family protein n=1 Tax=Shewanella sp. CG12_big_fil_rev_8_21_14_0_65_47_15 TaxID=1975537 RepID=UPI000CABFF7E|nr:DsbA family protein [Shewanella sp. CG12_big_fil_rev_8_21_14_0_65_47_15]PIW62463.1 MAG: protein-disulfide isomerase [Shewanella sp. CG12_big_fil_rev_8_21_14_0_65_47_15]
MTNPTTHFDKTTNSTSETKVRTLHAIIDPLCGWCYAAAPLLDAAAKAGFTIQLHGGGMLTGSRRKQIDANWRDYVMPHDLRIAELTGQPFGESYFDGLLRDTTIVLDSAPPIKAMLAVDTMGGDALAYLHSVQLAHYRDGHCASDEGNLARLAVELGLDPISFAQHYAQGDDKLYKHILGSRALLNLIGAQGFPTMAMETEDGKITAININRYYGQPAQWVSYLKTQFTGTMAILNPNATH